MKRREVLSALSIVSTGVLLVPPMLFSGCDPGPYKYELFNWGDTELLNEIADVIIPATPGVPGAKAANVGDFIQIYVTDCFKAREQKVFLDGIQTFKALCETKFDDDFISLSSELKTQIVNTLDEESKDFQKQLKTDDPEHFFKLLKNTILFGYYTSEIGATKALRYVAVPGYQKGEIPYRGGSAWAL